MQNLGNISSPPVREQASFALAEGDVLAVDNYSVWALWLNAANPSAIQTVERAKGRDGRPFGLTMPNDTFLDYVDFDRIHPEDRKLFEDADALTSRLGAIAFMRFPGKQRAADDLPGRVWSRDPEGKPVVQNWSPEGKNDIHDLLLRAGTSGVQFRGVTSLNPTGKPEATSSAMATEFITACEARNSIRVIHDEREHRYIAGSYPVVETTIDQGLTLARSRKQGIGALLISRLLEGHPINVPKLGVENHFGAAPEELDGLQGPELRSGMLELFGWQ